MAPPPQKLIARDREDLTIISALMQDAVLTPQDIAYDAAARRLVLTANRYVREKGGLFKKPRGWRRRTGLHFNHVLSLRHKGFSRSLPALSLLAIRLDDTDKTEDRPPAEGAEGVVIRLDFAAGVSLRLTADCIEAVMTDRGEPWEALARPTHP